MTRARKSLHFVVFTPKLSTAAVSLVESSLISRSTNTWRYLAGSFFNPLFMRTHLSTSAYCCSGLATIARIRQELR